MKAFLKILLILTLTSCSVDEYNQEPTVKEGVHQNHDAVQEQLIGRYKSVEGQTNYLPGTIEITPVSVLINVPGYSYSIDLATVSTHAKIDCYFTIYFSDGTVIQISDWIVLYNEIRLVVNGKLIIRLIKVTDDEPTPEPVPAPQEPVKDNEPIFYN